MLTQDLHASLQGSDLQKIQLGDFLPLLFWLPPLWVNKLFSLFLLGSLRRKHLELSSSTLFLLSHFCRLSIKLLIFHSSQSSSVLTKSDFTWGNLLIVHITNPSHFSSTCVTNMFSKRTQSASVPLNGDIFNFESLA